MDGWIVYMLTGWIVMTTLVVVSLKHNSELRKFRNKHRGLTMVSGLICIVCFWPLIPFHWAMKARDKPFWPPERLT